MQKTILTLVVSSCLWASIATSAEDDNVALGYSTLKNTELIALEPQLCMGPEGGFGYGAGLRLLTFKWRYFSFTLLELGYGIAGRSVYNYAGIRPGFPLHLVESGRHKLRFGLGIDFAVTFEGAESHGINGAGLFLSPSVHYIYQTSGGFFFSAGISAFLFTAGSRNGYPFFLLPSIGIGFSAG